MPQCRQCEKHFPIYVLIDGKKRNLQRRKFCIECSPYGCHNTKKVLIAKEIEEKICRKCNLLLPRNQFYTRRQNELLAYCKTCHNKQLTVKSRKLKKKALEYKGGRCQHCGYNRYEGALEFHHLDPATKDIRLSSTRRSWELLKEELDKCILLCACCHREEHGRINKVFNLPPKNKKN